MAARLSSIIFCRSGAGVIGPLWHVLSHPKVAQTVCFVRSWHPDRKRVSEDHGKLKAGISCFGGRRGVTSSVYLVAFLFTREKERIFSALDAMGTCSRRTISLPQKLWVLRNQKINQVIRIFRSDSIDLAIVSTTIFKKNFGR